MASACDDHPDAFIPVQTGFAGPLQFLRLPLEPGPGERCSCCRRPMPGTALEVWMQQHGESFDSLGLRLAKEPAVVARLAMPGIRAESVSKNLLFRLNHQDPAWNGPRANTVAAVVQPLLLELTGLRVEDLQNLKPHSDGYSCTNVPQRPAPPPDPTE